MEAFEHHLVYEINMLRHTFVFLTIPAWSPELRNALIEAFCVHARNLVEFFDEKSATPGQSEGYLGAKHFSNGYEPWKEGGPNKVLRNRLNRQISHLTYDRTSEKEGKIGPDEQIELFKLIQREIELFGKCLRDPYKASWPFSEASKPTIDVPTNLSATNATTSISSLHLGWTGYNQAST